MMGAFGLCLMALVAGRDVLGFLQGWVAEPTMYGGSPGALLPFAVPVELSFLAINFYGNWNAKKVSHCTASHLAICLPRVRAGNLRTCAHIDITTSSDSSWPPLYALRVSHTDLHMAERLVDSSGVIVGTDAVPPDLNDRLNPDLQGRSVAPVHVGRCRACFRRLDRLHAGTADH